MGVGLELFSLCSRDSCQEEKSADSDQHSARTAGGYPLMGIGAAGALVAPEQDQES